MAGTFAEPFPALGPEQALAAYEAIRARLPAASFPVHSIAVPGLDAIAAQVDVFVFDAFGVLNVGERAIAGAVEVLGALRAAGKRVFVVTNGASLTPAQTPAKFAAFGFDFTGAEIISSREPAEAVLRSRGTGPWGVMGPRDHGAGDLPVAHLLLGDDPEPYARAGAFLMLSTHQWCAHRQGLLEAALRARPRPVVVANPDLVAPREHGLSTEPGYCAQRLVEQLGLAPEFHGKPFASVFELLLSRLPVGLDRRRVAMVGDTLHTDVLGGAAMGFRTVLVTGHGLFKGLDPARHIARSGIVPDWIVPSI